MSLPQPRWLLLMLCMAVLLAATLGVMHRSVHGHGMHPSMGAAERATHASDPAGAETLQAADDRTSHTYFAHLFGTHADNDCRLYDQLAHAAALPSVPLLVLPIVLPAATFAWLEGEAVRRWVALFDARGPPLTC